MCSAVQYCVSCCLTVDLECMQRTVPYPLLGENTLVLSDVLCVAPNAQGRLALFCRQVMIDW